MNDCIFCKIIAGDVPCAKIYEDEHTFAFLDISPITKGHTLIIPKEHYGDMLDTPEIVLSHLMTAVKNVCHAISSLYPGFRVVQNNKKEGGQDVMHIHFHVIPMTGQNQLPRWSGQSYGEGEAENIAEEIRAVLHQT